MGKHSAIEWTDHTFNPWWGCEKVSPACANCYAETWSKRTGLSLWGKTAPRRFFSEKHWHEPALWNRAALKEGVRRRVFCASMADVFEDRADLEPWRKKLCDLICATPGLDWLLLTKRPENVLMMTPWRDSWPRNVWVGTTVEDQARAGERVPFLARIPARVRFLSCEPLLGLLDLSVWLRQIHWVIVGGESGRSARPTRQEWVEKIRDQVLSAGVPFHFKQWGEWGPDENAANSMKRLGKKTSGRVLGGRVWDQLPSVGP